MLRTLPFSSRRVVIVALVALCGACGGTVKSHVGGNGDTAFIDTTDVTPPTLSHTPITDSQQLGTDVPVSCTASDAESGMFQVKLYYKTETGGAGDWQSQLMMPGTGVDEYDGTIPGDQESSGGMNYYIAATDNAQNEADSPTKGVDDPWHFRLYE